MQKLKALFAAANPATAFRNACIAGAVSATAAPAFAADTGSIVDLSAIKASLDQGGSDMKAIAGYIAATLVILAVAALVFAMLRRG